MLTRGQLKRKADQFKKLRQVSDLSEFLKVDSYHLQLLALNPKYSEFLLPKSHGGFRLIEDPEFNLKQIQRSLNFSCQAEYINFQPENVHGFCIHAKNEKARNIFTNARTHLHCKYLLKVDLLDFFHQVKMDQLKNLFSFYFPNFESEAINVLSGILLYKGRLPMGAPTSPVLSNFALLDLDQTIADFARDQNWNFSRYADDYSFSSQDTILSNQILKLHSIFDDFNWLLNRDKTILYNEQDSKEVTGLIIDGDDISLPKDYLPKLEIELKRYIAYCETESRYARFGKDDQWRLFKSELEGKFQFALQVENENEVLSMLYEKFQDAHSIPERFESVDWLDLHYGYY